MDKFWNGSIIKHRDFAHRSVFEHIMDHSAAYATWDVRLAAILDPATLDVLDRPIVVYVVRIRFQNNKTYDYIVPSREFPTRDDIRREVDRQHGTKLYGEKRDIADILDFDSYREYQRFFDMEDEELKWHKQ